MEDLKKHLNILWKKIYKSIMDTVDLALDTPDKKKIAGLTLLILEAMLFYVMAILSVGIWIGTPNPFAIFWACLTTEKKYPWGGFLLLSVTILTVAFIILKLSLLTDENRNFKLSDSTVYGNAREISKTELEAVADIVPKDAAMGTILGQLDRTEMNVISNKPRTTNGNMVIFGPSGSGKSFSFVKPFVVQAIRRGESVLITDSKGEIWGETVELARRHGYIVRRIDFKNPQCSDGWAVLKELRCDDMRAIVFAKTVMANTGNLSDPHISAEQSLLKAVCLYVERCPETMIPRERKTFYTAYSMLLAGADELDKSFSAIRYDSHMKPAYEAYRSFVSGSERLKGNVISNLCDRLNVMSSPPIQHLTSIDDVDLELPGKKRCIYYVAISDQHEALKFLSSLFFSFAYLNLSDFADKQLNRKLPIPVNFVLEEMYSCVGFLPSLTQYLATCRSRAINFFLIVQDIGQIMELYGDNLTATVLSNCSIHLCLGFNDQKSAQYYEWRAGESTVSVKTERHEAIDPPIRLGLPHSTGDGRRNFYTSNELMKIKQGQCLIVWQGYDSKLAYTLGINRFLEYLQGRMPVILPDVHIPLSDEEGRAFLRAKEEERVEAYEQWISEGGNPWKDYLAPEHTNIGPMTGTELPPIIPYGELEDMALAHSAQARLSKEEEDKLNAAKAANAVMERMASQDEEADPNDLIIDDDSDWDYVPGWDNDYTEEAEEEAAEEEAKEDPAKSDEAPNTSTSAQNPPCEILDAHNRVTFPESHTEDPLGVPTGIGDVKRKKNRETGAYGSGKPFPGKRK